MAKKRAYQTEWYSEKQLGDMLWKNREACFFYQNDQIFREVQIGFGRVDFVTFSLAHISLWELKITATVDSVIQIAKYQRDLHEYLRQTFYAGNRDHKKCPNFESHIIARYFDSKIIELCAEFNIYLWEVKIDENGFANLEPYEDNHFHHVPENSQIVDLVINYFDPEVKNG